jgi:hypothetical protein
MRLIQDDGDDEDDEEDDEIVLVQCKHCRKTIWEESVSCEHCGHFVTLEDEARWRPWWLIVGVVAGLLCVIRWILH